MFKASGELKTSPKYGKSIEKHQNTLKFSQFSMLFECVGRLPYIPEPDLHEKSRSEESRVGKEFTARRSPDH